MGRTIRGTREILATTMASVVSIITAASAAPNAKLIGLGDLPGGVFTSAAQGVSADGSVVVGFSFSSNGPEAFRWTETGGIVGLGDLPGGDYPGFQSVALGTSSDGSVVVGLGLSNIAPGGGGYEGFRWTETGGMVGIGKLPGYHPSVTGAASIARAVSDNGSVIVGDSKSSKGSEAFRWTQAEGMVGLGGLSSEYDHVSSNANAISGDGSTIVGQSTIGTLSLSGCSFSELEAFVWTENGGMVGLGHLPGGQSSTAAAVSATGMVIVGSEFFASSCEDPAEEAVRWAKGDGIVGLGTLPNHSRSIALGVSADGSVIVGHSGNDLDDQEVFIWDAANGMRNLEDVVAAAGVDLGGWDFYQLGGISADGRTIVGEGFNPNGDPEGWLVRLEISSVSAPSTFGLLGCGLLALIRCIRRRS